jgi:hypothetical protein
VPNNDPLLAEPARSAFRWVTDGFKKLTKAGSDKIEDVISRFDRLVPVIEQAGFEVSEIGVVMSVPPSVIARVQPRLLLEGDARQAFLDSIAGRNTASRMIKALYRAAAFGERVEFSGFEFFEIEVEFSLIPSVNVKFSPVKEELSQQAIGEI